MATYIVTGASSGIGREIALKLARDGNEVIALGRNAGRLAEVARQQSGVVAMEIDLANTAAVMELAERLTHLKPDGLINNAGVQWNVTFFDPEYTPQKIADEISANLTAPAILTRILAPAAPGPFVVVNVNSGLAIHPKSTSAIYSASKAGLWMFSDAVEAQARPGMRVVDVVLPLVDTPMTAGRGSGKISASKAADEIIAAMKSGKPRVYVGKAKLLRVLNAVAPWLAARIMKRM